jgi:hypothetical protein
MTWTKLTDTLADDPVCSSLSRDVRLLHLEGLIWCNKQLTDGVIPATALRWLTDSADAEAGAAKLVVSRLWKKTTTGWVIPRFTKPDGGDQEPAAVVLARQAARARVQASNYAKRAAARTGIQTPIQTVLNPSDSRFRQQFRPIPDPSRPEGIGTGSAPALTGGHTAAANEREAEASAKARADWVIEMNRQGDAEDREAARKAAQAHGGGRSCES